MMSAQGMLAAPQRVHEFVQNFDWEEKGLPLSKSGAMITLVLAYLTMIGMGRQIFSRPMQLPSAVPAAHNLVLCIGSLIMFVGTAWEIYQVHRCSAVSCAPQPRLVRVTDIVACRDYKQGGVTRSCFAFHQAQKPRYA